MTTDPEDTDRQHQPIEEVGASLARSAFQYFTEQLTSSLTAARALVDHNLTRGEVLEDVFRHALRNFLPERFQFLRGQIVDGLSSSRQQDLVIVDLDTGTSLWRMGDIGVIPIESVAGTVEIKTSLDLRQVRSAVANVQSVKQMVLVEHAATGGAPVVPFGGIVGFDVSSSFDAIADAFGEACAGIDEPTQRSDALLVVGHGVVMPGTSTASGLRLRYWHEPGAQDGRQLVFHGAEDGALLFLHRLSEHIRRYAPPELDLIAYGNAGRGKGRWKYQGFTPENFASEKGQG